jgi:hypothetical protein
MEDNLSNLCSIVWKLGKSGIGQRGDEEVSRRVLGCGGSRALVRSLVIKEERC